MVGDFKVAQANAVSAGISIALTITPPSVGVGAVGMFRFRHSARAVPEDAAFVKFTITARDQTIIFRDVVTGLAPFHTVKDFLPVLPLKDAAATTITAAYVDIADGAAALDGADLTLYASFMEGRF